jgi:quaternary ammonium compound-resistance protein SugE
MGWLYIIIAGILEIVWAAGLKHALDTRSFVTWLWTIVAMILSFAVLQQGMRTIPLGTAYAVWTGIGAVGAAAVGMIWFHEPRDPVRIACIALIAAGIIGLKFFSAAPGSAE